MRYHVASCIGSGTVIAAAVGLLLDTAARWCMGA